MLLAKAGEIRAEGLTKPPPYAEPLAVEDILELDLGVLAILRQRPRATADDLGAGRRCIRNWILEDWRAGRGVISPAGDFSDVKFVTPLGETPCLNASRISDPEMRALMRQGVDAVFAFLGYPGHPIRLGGAARWAKPKLNETMAAGILPADGDPRRR